MPQARVCYVCGRPTLLPGYERHVAQCRALFEKREAQKPPKERRPCPADPMLFASGGVDGGRGGGGYLDEANAAAQKAWESTLSSCGNCGRSFLPEKLAIHQRSCTSSNPAKSVGGRIGASSDMPGAYSSMYAGAGAGAGGAPSLAASGRGNSSKGLGRTGPAPGAIDPMTDFPTYGHLQKCSNCGRNFNEVSFAKHARICKKVFSQKRKVYDSAKHRREGTELEVFAGGQRRAGSGSGAPRASALAASMSVTRDRRGAAGGGGGGGGDRGARSGGGMSKWKAQSLEFRRAMRMAKQVSMAERQSKATGVPLHRILDANPRLMAASTASAPVMGMMQCPTCGRSFNEQAGARHIPKCKDIINKPTRLVRGSGAPAYSSPPPPIPARAAGRAPTSRGGGGYDDYGLNIPAQDVRLGQDQPVRMGPGSMRSYSQNAPSARPGASSAYGETPVGSRSLSSSGSRQPSMQPGAFSYGDAHLGASVRRGSRDETFSRTQAPAGPAGARSGASRALYQPTPASGGGARPPSAPRSRRIF